MQDACRIINHQLVTTLHLPDDTEIIPDSALLNEEVKTLAENDWQLLATQSNVGLQQARLTVKMNEQKVKLERSELLPKIALVAAEHLDGPITIEVPVLDNNFNYWYVGVGIKYNFSSLFKNNKKVHQAKLNIRKAQEEYSLLQEQIENGVQANYVNFLTSFTDLRTQEKSVELADQNYNITSNRYKNDLALLTDMLDASNMKLSADLNLVNARINVIYSYYKMKYITHTL
ncbi:TolC family protein [Bacteroides finegoldii]|uniref:TolC family protein n=1 Tax=Bacteroides finegoldii TaxID=338188 RepID=UPI00397E0DA3